MTAPSTRNEAILQNATIFARQRRMDDRPSAFIDQMPLKKSDSNKQTNKQTAKRSEAFDSANKTSSTAAMH